MVVISASYITRIDIIYYQYYKGGGNICICQVQEIYRGNSGSSGCQVQTYEMSEGTSASAYVLHPFQTLVPRFWNGEDRKSEIGESEKGSEMFSE